jgi:2-polyprenyl-6-methoxyphenol hydroxylase-like FAD-dependent oxidoreductase
LKQYDESPPRGLVWHVLWVFPVLGLYVKDVTCSSSLQIGADGYNSGLRQIIPDQQYMTSDYQQMAVVATLKLTEVRKTLAQFITICDLARPVYFNVIAFG